MNAVLLTPPNHTSSTPMNTKLTLLLALATASALHAEKPGFNGPRAFSNAPASRPMPSSGGSSSSRINAGQIIGIARSLLPLVQSMSTPPAPRYAPPPRKAQPAAKKPVVVKKPAANRSSGSGFKAPAAASIPNKAPATRPMPDSRLGGLSGQQAAGIRQGREIAEGLASLESLRASFGEVAGLENVLHQPGNVSRAAGNPAETFGEESNEYDDGSADIHNPLDKNSGPGAGLTNVRSRAANSRQALDPTGEAIQEDLEGDDRPSGRPHSELTVNPDGSSEETETTMVEGENGQLRGISVTQHQDSNGRTTGYSSVETIYGRCSITTVERTYDRAGHSTSRTVSGNIFCGGRTGCDINPAEGASLGGPIGPTVGDAIGLTDLDLLRQHANGEAPSGGSNFMTRRTNAVQVRPASPDGTTRGTRRVAPIDLLQPEGRGINVIGGGDRPD